MPKQAVNDPERELRALLKQCMEGVADPFSVKGELAVFERFVAAVEGAIREICMATVAQREAPRDGLIEEIYEWAFNELYARLRQEAEGHPMGSTWQPMSTAPTGTWILTYSQDGTIRVAMWIKGAINEPTHWMPLPPPPK